MTVQERNNIIIGLGGILITLSYIYFREYVILVAIGVVIALIVAAFDSYIKDIEENKGEIKKINEKLNIHNQLIDIKAELKNLKKGKK